MAIRKNKWIGIVAAALLCILLASCQKKADDSVFYESAPLFCGLPSGEVKNLAVSGDTLYWLMEEDTIAGSRTVLYSSSTDGSDLLEIDTSGKGYSLRAIVSDGAGNVIECNNMSTGSVIRKLDASGNVLWSVEADGEAVSVGSSEDYVAAAIGMDIMILSQKGEEQRRFTLDESCYGSLLVLEDNRIYEMISTEEGKVVLTAIDPETGKAGERVELPEFAQEFHIEAGAGNDLLLLNSKMAAGYEIGEESCTVLADFAQSSIMLENPHWYRVLEEGRLVLSDASGEVRELVRTGGPEPEGKTVLTVGSTYPYQYAVRLVGEDIEAFNASSEEYFVRLADYSVYSAGEDPEGGLRRLEADFAEGKGPDILLIDGNETSFGSYADMDALEDLYVWMDGDARFDRGDFLANILAACEDEGKLYGIVPRFQVYTLMGRSSVVGDTPGWTAEDALRTAKEHDGSWMFHFLSGEDLLGFCLQYAGYACMEETAGAVSFDEESFAQLLEWTAIPSAYDDNTSESDSAEQRWAAWSALELTVGEEILLEPITLDAFADFAALRGDGTCNGVDWGGELTLIGYPSDEGNGAAFCGDIRMAMSAASEHKEGAWQFISRYLSYDWQMGNTRSATGSGYFPIRLEALEELANENADAEADPTEGLTREELEDAMAYLKTVEYDCMLDAELIELIQEEAERYYSGERTAEETAEGISKRLFQN